jgi:hypothetical protein
MASLACRFPGIVETLGLTVDPEQQRCYSGYPSCSQGSRPPGAQPRLGGAIHTPASPQRSRGGLGGFESRRSTALSGGDVKTEAPRPGGELSRVIAGALMMTRSR